MPFRPVWAILARGFSRARDRKPMRALFRGDPRHVDRGQDHEQRRIEGAIGSEAGGTAALEKHAQAQGKTLEWEGPGPLGIYSARIGEDRYTVANTALRD